MSVELFEVSKAEALASIQDLGRRQSFHHGVTEGGAMDMHAMFWANHLLTRPAGAPVIEVTIGMFELVFKQDCHIAITGANLNASLNQVPIKPWRSFAIKTGDIVSFMFPQTGVRAYLAINADLDLVGSFDSLSNVSPGNGVLKQGDCIFGSIMSGKNQAALGETVVPARFIPDYTEPLTLDVIPAYQFDRFASGWVEQFLQTEFQINTSSNRMAYRFSGDTNQHQINNLHSEGIAYGAIQVPPDGQPVVLLNDRQTMGGYPKLGCITRLSGSALAQHFSPDSVKFRMVSLQSARQELAEFMNFFYHAVY